MALDPEKSLVARLAKIAPSDLEIPGSGIKAETIRNPDLRKQRLERWVNQLSEMHRDRRDTLEIEKKEGLVEKHEGIDRKNRIAEREILDNILSQNLTLDEARRVLIAVSYHHLAEVFKLYCDLIRKETGPNRKTAV